MKCASQTAALLILIALPAMAQDIAFSPDATLSCLEDRGGEDCIGLSAGACTETPDGYTTVGMGFCFGRERDWWDARLNAVYQALRAADQAEDTEMKDIGATVPEMAPALLDMQRAWIGYRDALCEYERTKWGGGTGQGPATAACQMHETARQTLLLEARLAEYEAR
ncbi:MAG: lysozyme inhibitor LprI family protein [Pseudomonadota bacterium]